MASQAGFRWDHTATGEAWQVQLAEWRARYGRMRAIADSVAASRQARAWVLLRAAGLGDWCHLHNAFVGERWPGVDYSLARQARRVADSMWEGYDILQRWDERVRSL